MSEQGFVMPLQGLSAVQCDLQSTTGWSTCMLQTCSAIAASCFVLSCCSIVQGLRAL